MERKAYNFSFGELGIDAASIERFIGDPQLEHSDLISWLIKEALEDAIPLCDIHAEYCMVKIVDKDEKLKTISVGGLVFEVRKIVYSQLRKSDSLAIFLCTAGSAIGIKSREEMSRGDLLKGYLLDLVGSVVVEAAADRMQADLESSLDLNGFRITNRFSPGYCGWNVEEQFKLFSFFPYNYCGIRLTPSALMDPVKSVSGFIGIGKNVRRLPYTCKLCDMADCIYRRQSIPRKTGG
jgi:hypothetical protein